MKSVLDWLLGVLVFLFIAFLPVISWYLARQNNSRGYLQWCIVTKASLVKGLKINNKAVDWAIRRVKSDDSYVTDANQVVGNYALADLAEGEILKPTHFSEFAPAKVPTDGATVPMEVKTEHASSLKPGMRLAFVQEKEKLRTMIPGVKRLQGKRKASGFELLSITVSSKDASITTLTIAVEKADLASIPALASGQWRPVILR